jgi:hypothetical protein
MGQLWEILISQNDDRLETLLLVLFLQCKASALRGPRGSLGKAIKPRVLLEEGVVAHPVNRFPLQL